MMIYDTLSQRLSKTGSNNMMFKRVYILTSLAVMLLSIGFLSGYLANEYLSKREARFPILIEAYDLLQKNGIHELPSTTHIEYGMIHGMIEAYGDPYTLFVEPVQHELNSNTLQGAFGGIGVDIVIDPTGRVLLYPYPGSPAEKTGLQAGDILLMVDDIEIGPDPSLEAVTAWLRGPVGEQVDLLIARDPRGAQHHYQITRAEFPLPSVTYRLDVEDQRIGVISINVIAASTTEELITAVEYLNRKGARALILDLRENYGGLLTAGVDIARLFLKEGIVIQQKYRNKNIETYFVEKPGPFNTTPIVVLIDQNTASAAEIIAGALKNHGRATVMGDPSMGKDSIQLVFELSDGSSLHVTAAKWWIPGLEAIFGESGLQPDVLITGTDILEEQDPVLAGARAVLAEQISP